MSKRPRILQINYRLDGTAPNTWKQTAVCRAYRADRRPSLRSGPRIERVYTSLACTGLVGGSAATPQMLPNTSAESTDSAGPGSAVIALLAALASVGGLALVGRLRRNRTSLLP